MVADARKRPRTHPAPGPITNEPAWAGCVAEWTSQAWTHPASPPLYPARLFGVHYVLCDGRQQVREYGQMPVTHAKN